MTSTPAIRPDRVRRIGGQSFAFIPHRLLRDGFLATMTLPERALYLLLVLVADRDGMSFYGYDRICSLLELTLDSYLETRNGLVDKDLIAFDGRRFQVLSLPCSPVQPSNRPLRSTAELHEHDPGTIRQCILESLNVDRSDQ